MRPSLRLLGYLQWTGLLAGATIFALTHLTGWWTTQAECNAPGQTRGIGNDAWMIALMSASGLCIAVAGAAAAIVCVRTRGADPGDGPVTAPSLGPAEPYGRLQFFSAAALVANVLFFLIVMLDGFGAIFNVACRQS